MNLSEEKKILKYKGYKLIEVYGNSDSEILADPSFWDYSKQVQHRFKNDGGFIIKPEEQEKLLNNRYYINILKDNSIRLPKQYIQRFTQPFVEKIILACYKGNMNVKDAAYYLGEFSYQAGTMIKSDWEQWVARQLSTFNESINKQLKFRYNMNLNEAVKELEEHGYLVEYTKDEYDSAMKNRQDPNNAARSKVFDDPEYKRLSNRKSRELRAHSTDWGDYNKMRVPGKKPGTTRLATASERRDAYEKNKIKNKEILQKYNSLQKQMMDKLNKKYLKILEDEDMTMKEYESNCHDWCIINWFDAPGSGYAPVIVQKGYNSKEEGEKDLEQFKKWAWTEVEYTDVEQQCYALYPTEIIEEMGLDYKEKDVPEGEPPEFKANPYYRTNYWGD